MSSSVDKCVGIPVGSEEHDRVGFFLIEGGDDNKSSDANMSFLMHEYKLHKFS